VASGTTWDGDDYQRRFDRLAAAGTDVHGEADFVTSLSSRPASVLDAGCGTGRVAIELARRGVDVVGVDVDPSMLATARRRAPEITWVDGYLAGTAADGTSPVDLGTVFDVVLMAGNVPLFTPRGTQPQLVATCAAHLAEDGRLVAGFSLDRGYAATRYDDDCAAAGLTLVERFSTWARDPYAEGGDYAVSVHRRA
jgi:SAM-dependent methyltransferase